MVHTKLTFSTTIVFSGLVEELPNVQKILDMLQAGELDIDFIDTHSTIGNNFVIMVKPRDQKETPGGDIPF